MAYGLLRGLSQGRQNHRHRRPPAGNGEPHPPHRPPQAPGLAGHRRPGRIPRDRGGAGNHSKRIKNKETKEACIQREKLYAGFCRGKNEDKLVDAMKNVKKIGCFGHKRIPSREGGVEIVVEELCTRIVKLGYDVTCFNRGGHHVSGAEFDIKKADNYKGIHIKTVPTIEKKGLAAVSSAFFATLKCAFGKYDVVHVHAEGPALFCGILKLFGKRVIMTCHGLDHQRTGKWNAIARRCILQGEKSAVKYADEIIVLSKNVQKYFKDTYGRDTKFISNGVNKPVICDAKEITEKYGLEKDSYFLFLGRIVPEKGIHYLIDAFKDVKTEKKLVIAGGASDTDDYMQELKNLAKDDKRILFAGFVQGVTLDELYSNAYVYVLPSDLEGMPLSLLEAMSYGNCCIVSDIPECTEVVEDKAIIFNKSDTHSLHEKLVFAVTNEEEVMKLKNNASDFICNKYNWDDVVNRTLDLYRSF